MSLSISTVTPVYSGAAYLENLVQELRDFRESLVQSNAPVQLLEAIFVDDSSIDESSVVLKKLESEYAWVRVITLSRNYGQHSATVAGICHTTGDWVVTLDEDLQHRPEYFKSLFRKQVDTGADVVYGSPESAAHGGSWRDIASRSVKKLLARWTDTPQIKIFNSFRLIRGSIARAAATSSSSQTYFDIAISWYTNSSVSEILPMVDNRFVETASSGYNLKSLVRHGRRLFVSSQLDLVSIGLAVGVFSVISGFVITLIVVAQKIFFPEVIALSGWVSLVALNSFFAGVTLGLLCICLEYINILSINQLGKPTFFVVDRQQDEILKRWFAPENREDNQNRQ